MFCRWQPQSRKIYQVANDNGEDDDTAEPINGRLGETTLTRGFATDNHLMNLFSQTKTVKVTIQLSNGGLGTTTLTLGGLCLSFDRPPVPTWLPSVCRVTSRCDDLSFQRFPPGSDSRNITLWWAVFSKIPTWLGSVAVIGSLFKNHITLWWALIAGPRPKDMLLTATIWDSYNCGVVDPQPHCGVLYASSDPLLWQIYIHTKLIQRALFPTGKTPAFRFI